MAQPVSARFSRRHTKWRHYLSLGGQWHRRRGYESNPSQRLQYTEDINLTDISPAQAACAAASNSPSLKLEIFEEEGVSLLYARPSSPEQLGLHSSPEQLGLHSSPEQLGLHSSPEQLGLHSSPEPLGLHSSPEQLGLHSSPEQLGLHSSLEKLALRSPLKQVD